MDYTYMVKNSSRKHFTIRSPKKFRDYAWRSVSEAENIRLLRRINRGKNAGIAREKLIEHTKKAIKKRENSESNPAALGLSTHIVIKIVITTAVKNLGLKRKLTTAQLQEISILAQNYLRVRELANGYKNNIQEKFGDDFKKIPSLIKERTLRKIEEKLQARDLLVRAGNEIEKGLGTRLSIELEGLLTLITETRN